jgi:hypothetical protein
VPGSFRFNFTSCPHSNPKSVINWQIIQSNKETFHRHNPSLVILEPTLTLIHEVPPFAVCCRTPPSRSAEQRQQEASEREIAETRRSLQHLSGPY